MGLLMGTPTIRGVLDTGNENELILDILSYSGGENSESEDHIMQSNEARVVKNWDAISLGGMQRSKGFNRVASEAGATDSDLAHFHFNDTSSASRVLGIFKGGLYYENGGNVSLITGGVFTANQLHHAVDGADDAWITSLTDNLRRYTIAGGLVTPSSQPSSARERIYRHKNRLVAEGGGKTVYGSRAGTGNWTAANAWSLSNDAWSIDLPNPTKGCAPNFPSGDEILTFTEFEAYALYGFPNVAFRPIPSSRGCSAPHSIALGDEGVYFVSKRPSLGVFLFDGVRFTNLTHGVEQNFVEKIDFDNRVTGVYRDQKYYLFYNEANSGVSYQNRVRIYDSHFGRWMEREVASGLSDNLGLPMLLTKQNNELYVWSSRNMKLYELETADESDEGNNTAADYITKTFTSRDFQDASSGKNFPVDDVIMKLLKVTVSYYGTTGSLTLGWEADDGRSTGSLTFDLTASGALINSNFTVNSSSVISASDISDRVVTKSFKNNAVGRRFQFQILNSGSSTRPKVKKIKIYATALTDR